MLQSLLEPAKLMMLVLNVSGSMICWQGNTIHWGSKCSKYAQEPRKSIAMSFRVARDLLPMTESEMAITGRAPLTQEEVLNLTMPERVSMIAKSLIMYAQWFPCFQGFNPEHLHVQLDEVYDYLDQQEMLQSQA